MNFERTNLVIPLYYYNVMLFDYRNCLENSGQEFNAGRERDIFSQVYPGQIYDLNEQCRLMYGNESSYVGVSIQIVKELMFNLKYFLRGKVT